MRANGKKLLLAWGLCLIWVGPQLPCAQARSCRPSLIPNGSKNECLNCHVAFGGDVRNAFGQEVERRINGSSRCDILFWNASLAALDSDGDGFTNGQELQDPTGSWQPGQPDPGQTALVSNPGRAESVPPTATATPTAPPSATPTATAPPDTDGDGVPDALEEGPSNVSAGKTNRYLNDSDGDGLEDGEEDANRNGTRDSGERNARARDSDGDGLIDGVESRLLLTDALNALDPAAYTDADGDRLPDTIDPNDAHPDSDGDRFGDAYEAAAAGAATAANNSAQVPPLGDVSGDSFVTNLDALVVQAVFLGNLAPTSPPIGLDRRHNRADPSRDGFITNVDALVLQSFFLGNLARLPL